MRVLVTGAGGSMGAAYAYMLRGTEHDLIWADCDRIGRMFARRTGRFVLELPRGDSPEFVDALTAAIAHYKIDATFILPDTEIGAIASAPRTSLELKSWGRKWNVPLPPPCAARTCLDKWRTALAAEGASPKSFLVDISAEPWIELPWWVRPPMATGGAGARRIDTAEEWAAWRLLNPHVDEWLVQEFLPGRNLNATLLYYDGSLIAHACGERLGYVLSQVSQSGVTGDTGDFITTDDSAALAVAQRAVARLPGQSHGFYSVDLREDVSGAPKVTEINARLAGRPVAYAEAGCNFPALWLKLVEGWRPKEAVTPELGVRVHRRVAQEPVIERGGE